LYEEDIMNLIMHFSRHRLPCFFRRCSCADHLLLHVLFSYGEREFHIPITTGKINVSSDTRREDERL
jgi:hypothetical protein